MDKISSDYKFCLTIHLKLKIVENKYLFATDFLKSCFPTLIFNDTS